MTIYNCNSSWPICLFDFTFKNQCPKYVAFRMQKTLDTFVIEDYFHPESAHGRNSSSKVRPEQAPQSLIPFGELLIQRNKHLCCNAEHPDFVKHFKMRFTAQDDDLFDNEFL